MVSLASMWEDTFQDITGTVKLKSEAPEMSRTCDEIPGVDEGFLEKKEEAKLECPICFEPFDMSCNAPLVLSCGHTLCKSCVLSLQRAVLKFQRLRPIVLPFFVSCPWCTSLSFRFIFKGNLKSPKKNYFLLWMVDSSHEVCCTSSHSLSCEGSNQQIRSEELQRSNQDELVPTTTHFESRVLLSYLYKSLFGVSSAQQVFRIGFLVIFVALYAARVSTFLLALYALIALFGSAFLLLPKLSFPGIGLVG